MKQNSDVELAKINGGTSISGTVIHAFVDLIDTLYEAGKGVGSSIRRIITDSICPL